MNLKFQIKNTQAAIEAWAAVDPDAVAYKLKLFREEGYPFTGPPACGSAACFAGHLPYFAHFSKMGVRASKDGIPFFESLPDLALSEYLFGSRVLFASQNDEELGSAHEVVTARLQANLERLLELRAGAKRKRSTKGARKNEP